MCLRALKDGGLIPSQIVSGERVIRGDERLNLQTLKRSSNLFGGLPRGQASSTGFKRPWASYCPSC